jgi:hypothetical protein
VLNGITAVTTRTMLSASAQRVERWFMATRAARLAVLVLQAGAVVVTSIPTRTDSLLGGVDP